MYFFNLQLLDFGPISQFCHRLSAINSSVDSVRKGLYYDLTALRLIFNQGCVQPSILQGVPLLQIQCNQHPHVVKGYVVLNLITTLHEYSAQKYGQAGDIAHALLSLFTNHLRRLRGISSYYVKQFRFLVMSLRTELTFTADDLPEGNDFMACKFMEID